MSKLVATVPVETDAAIIVSFCTACIGVEDLGDGDSMRDCAVFCTELLAIDATGSSTAVFTANSTGRPGKRSITPSWAS